jgi:hypothetical protein
MRAWVLLALPACVLSFPRAPDGTAGAPPAVFFTDLESGPNTVGIDGLGAIVTIYGRRFGAAPGRVTIGGGEVARYVAWADDRVSVLLGPATATGPVVVHTDHGDSNADVSFTVRPGNVYCVSTIGDDGGFGRWDEASFGCWRTLAHAVEAIAPGDIVYAREGVEQTVEDFYEAALSIEWAGEPGRPMALVAYPRERVRIAVDDLEGILVPRIALPGGAAHWVFAGLEIRAPVHAVDTSASHWRLVGNDISCTGNGAYDQGCVTLYGDDVTLLGNDVHDIALGRPDVTAEYYALRSAGARTTLAFNRFRDLGTYAVRLGAQRNPDMPPEVIEGARAFSNRFENTRCGGLELRAVNGTAETVEVFNNVFLRVGTGPEPCFQAVAFDVGCGASAASVTRAYNNTFVECGGLLGETAGALGTCASGASLVFDNNVVVQPAALRYAIGDGRLTGSRNVWFGAGAGPSATTESFESDPTFDPMTLRLGPASAALDLATGVVPARDFDGVPRPQGAGADPGAFEAF